MILDLLKTYSEEIHKTHPHKTTLNILGTGGGNDIFSAILVAMFFSKIKHQFSKIRVLGMLSPAAKHVNPINKEEYLNNIYNNIHFTNKIQRTVYTQDGAKTISLVDNLIPDLFEIIKCIDPEMHSKINIEEIVHINPYSKCSISEILSKYGEEPFLGVDVGGDIFSGIEEFQTSDQILSPLMDFSSLNLLSMIRKSYILELGLGTDGESGYEINSKSKIYKNLMDHCHSKFITVQKEIQVINLFSTLYHRISEVRAGHTIDFLLSGIYLDINKDNIQPKPKTLTKKHSYSYKNANPPIRDDFNVEIDVNIINTCFLINLDSLSLKSNLLFNLNFSSSEENAIQMANLMKDYHPNWATEIDGHYLKEGSVFYARLSKRIAEKEVTRLIDAAKLKTCFILK